MEKKKIIIAHPGQQHSYHSAIAMNDDLYKYITTFYIKKYNLPYFVSFLLKKSRKERMLNRHSDLIPDSKVKLFCSLEYLISSYIKYTKFKIIPRLKYYDKFGIKVGKFAHHHNVDAVIMYDTTASSCFAYLSKVNSNTLRILDVTIGSRIYAKELYEKEMYETNDYELKNEYPDLWNDNILRKFKDEIEYADYAIVGSNYVKKSLIYSGMNEENIFIVPYGASRRTVREKRFDLNKPLELLFVGQINYRKGLHRLLDVVCKFSPETLHLTLVGQYNLSNKLYRKYNKFECISFLGLINHSGISDIYSKADVFILPSLSEGMARVGLEALSCGLPVICTENSGVNDCIIDGYNGFVIPACDSNAILDRINWFLNHRDKIKFMSDNAFETSKQYTWEEYYDLYHKTVLKILEINKKK